MNHSPLLLENDFCPEKELAALLSFLPAEGPEVDFTLSPDARSFSVSARGCKAGLSGIGGRLSVNGGTADLSTFTPGPVDTSQVNGCTRHTIPLRSDIHGLSWTWTIYVRPRDVLMMATLENVSNTPITIDGWEVLRASVAPLSPDTRFFRWAGWDMGVEELGTASRRLRSSNLLHLSDKASGATLISSFLTLSRTETVHELELRSGSDALYSAKCIIGSYTLKPGQCFNSELCCICFHHDPYKALDAWVDKTAAIYKPELAEFPPVGWIGSNWSNNFATGEGESWESYALRNTDALRTRLHGFDIGYVWTSQSNLKDYIPGNWTAANDFELPSGLEGFCAKLLERGFKPGFWVSPFWFYSEAEGMLDKLHGCLLRGSDGEPLCEIGPWGWIYDDEDRFWYKMHKYYLDGTHPDALAYIDELFGYYRRIGVRYYMLDFLGIVQGAVHHDQALTPQQAGFSILRRIRAAAGPDTHLQTAVASSPGFSGTISAARIGRDFGEGRPLEGTSLNNFSNATCVLHDLHYSNTWYFLQNIAGSWFTHQKLYINDFNILAVDKPYPLEHARIAVTLFGLGGGSPLMLADNYLQMDEDRLRMVKLTLPRTTHSARPADLFERVGPDDYCRVMKLQIDTGWDSYLLAGLFNFDGEPYPIRLDFANLGLDPSSDYVVYDFWNNEYCGVFRGSFPCWVAPDTCRLLRIARKRSHPWLLSTDMHIQQGCCEVAELNWDEETKCLSGTLTRPAGESGNAYILMPRSYKLINNEDAYLLKELLDLNVIIRLPVSFGSDRTNFELFFADHDPRMLSLMGLTNYSTKEEWQAYMKENYTKEDTRVFE